MPPWLAKGKTKTSGKSSSAVKWGADANDDDNDGNDNDDKDNDDDANINNENNDGGDDDDGYLPPWMQKKAPKEGKVASSTISWD